jgi:hypothetical protein
MGMSGCSGLVVGILVGRFRLVENAGARAVGCLAVYSNLLAFSV